MATDSLSPEILNKNYYAQRIIGALSKSVQSVIEAGELLIEARERLSKDEYQDLLQNDLKLSLSTVHKLTQIAKDTRINSPEILKLLPASWSTLYEISSLSDDELDGAVTSNIIRPDAFRKDIESYKRQLKRREAGISEEPSVYDQEHEEWLEKRGLNEMFYFTEKEITILKNFALINTNMIFLPDKFSVLNGLKKSIMAYYHFEEPAEYEPFGIYDLHEFLKILDSMKNFRLNVREDVIEIHSEKFYSSLDYNLTNIQYLPEVSEKVPANFEKTPNHLVFNLTDSQINHISDIINIEKAEKLFVSSDGNKVYLTLAQGVEDIENQLFSGNNIFEFTVEEKEIKKNDLGANILQFAGDIFRTKTPFKFLPGNYNVGLSTKGISRWRNFEYDVDYYINVKVVSDDEKEGV